MKLADGTENVLGVPNSGASTNSNGGEPPVHDIGKLSHCVGVPKSNVKLAARVVEKRQENRRVGKSARRRCMTGMTVEN